MRAGPEVSYGSSGGWAKLFHKAQDSREQLFPVSLGEGGGVEMNLRGKDPVSMSKTPLEWANLRSAGQVPCPVCM